MSFGLPFWNCSGLPFWLALLWFSSDMSLVPQLACAACALFSRENLTTNAKKSFQTWRTFPARFPGPLSITSSCKGPIFGPVFRSNFLGLKFEEKCAKNGIADQIHVSSMDRENRPEGSEARCSFCRKFRASLLVPTNEPGSPKTT